MEVGAASDLGGRPLSSAQSCFVCCQTGAFAIRLVRFSSQKSSLHSALVKFQRATGSGCREAADPTRLRARVGNRCERCLFLPEALAGLLPGTVLQCPV